MKNIDILIIESYILSLIGIVTSLFFIFKIYKLIYKKERILKEKNMQAIAIPFYNEKHKIVDTILVCLMLFWIYCAISITADCIIDFGNVLKKNYNATKCTIITNTNEHPFKQKTVDCKTKNDVITFTFIGNKLPIGTIVNVSYYKRLKVGQINEVIPNEQENFGRIN